MPKTRHTLVLTRSFNGTQLQELILYEAASRLGVHKMADVRFIRDGLLPATQACVGAAPYFIRENDLDRPANGRDDTPVSRPRLTPVALQGSVANLADRSVWCTFAGNDFGDERVMIEFKGSHFERDVILRAVRWYVAYPISYRQLEEMMEEHGVEVDHATLNRWVLKYVPLLEQDFRVRKEAVGPSWRMDETYVRVKGAWKYLYRAVDKAGATVDFLLTAKRDRKAALRFLRKAIKWNGTHDRQKWRQHSGDRKPQCRMSSGHRDPPDQISHNIVEQDHRAIKLRVRPMLGFKSFRSAAVTLTGIEVMHMIRMGQLQTTGEVRPAQQFYSLAG